jgi:hypothetical protein
MKLKLMRRNPSSPSMVLGLTQPLTETSNIGISSRRGGGGWWGRERRLLCWPANLAAIICRLSMNYVMLDRLETHGYFQACTEISSGFIIEVDIMLAFQQPKL